MTNTSLLEPENEKFMRLLKGYQSEQAAKDLARRARNARIQKAKDTLLTLMQHPTT